MHDSNNLKEFLWLFSGLIAIQAALFIKIGAVSLLVLCGITLIINGLNIFYLQKRDDDLPGHILNATLLFYIISLCYKTGGFFSFGIFFLLFIPLFVTVFLRTKDKMIYMVAALGLFLIFYLDQKFNIRFILSDELINISTFRFYNFLALIIPFCGAIHYFTAKDKRTKILLDASQKECIQITANATAAMKIKDEFLANMSHEIRNPMNGIIGMMHVLLDSDLDEEQRSYSKIVYNSSRALLSIVNDILDLSKIEAGKLELDIRNFDLEVAIKDIVSLPELQARQKGVDFTYSIASDVPCLLKGDIGRIRQVVNNLTGNAIKFTDSGEVILTVTLKSDDENLAVLHFSVEDTGIGIKEDQIDALFASFTQADLSITKRFGGTGLGLAISKLIVEKMRGEIGAESIDMIGSTFWFTLQLAKQSDEEKAIDFSTQNIEDSKVLVLSDGSSLGKNFERNLDALEIDYDQAFDETEAIEMLRWAHDENSPFHLVIMEAKETDIVAETLGKKIKQDELFKHIKLILLTSVGKKGDARRFEDIGFMAFLSKPVEKSLLSDCIKAVLSQSVVDGDFNQSIITRYSIIEAKKHFSRILIVDDIETNLLTASALLGKQGYKTDEARNGLEAVEKHKENSYDLILMDCQMPVMDGLEATQQIRQIENDIKSSQVPIIAMTGNAFKTDREKCLEAGMNDFIAKPVEPDILSKKISSNLKGSVHHKSEQEQFEESKKEPEPDDTLVEPGQTDAVIENVEADMCFNRDKLSERFGGDEEMIELVLDSFFQEAPELIDKIEYAINEDDDEGVRLSSHALKGSAANVNADVLRKAALEIETDAKAQNSDSFIAKFETIQEEYNKFMKEANL
ncbi:MAG: response regulator [Desulfobacteraceae bacterium]|nr:response regulator [Desulfobacteraceae bacterium]